MTIIAVPKATTAAATSMWKPNAASAAQSANMSLSQKSSIPSTPGPWLRGRANMARTRWTASRKIPALPRQLSRSRSSWRYRSAGHIPSANPSAGSTAQASLKSIGGFDARLASSTIAATLHGIARMPCSRAASRETRTLASRSDAPAARSAVSSSAEPPWAGKPPNPAITIARRERRSRSSGPSSTLARPR